MMWKKLKEKITKFFDEWSYTNGVYDIMSDAFEYDIDADTVDKWLKANYENYCKRKSLQNK